MIFVRRSVRRSIGRVRPKLMTASTAILGLLPLVVLQFHGTEVERPLAIVMIGGLLTSTLFTLLVLPTMYLMAMRNNLGSNRR
jgi:cobalt-zinc-cadmium resistance protein CzcA